MTTKIIATAQVAFKHFTHGLETGEWDAFLNMLTDDFRFWFPVGTYKGENIGKEKATEFFHYVTDKVFTQGLLIELERITSNETSVVFEIKSQGQMLGYPYENQGAISFDIRGDKVCGYREYLGLLYQIKS